MEWWETPNAAATGLYEHERTWKSAPPAITAEAMERLVDEVCPESRDNDGRFVASDGDGGINNY